MFICSVFLTFATKCLKMVYIKRFKPSIINRFLTYNFSPLQDVSLQTFANPRKVYCTIMLKGAVPGLGFNSKEIFCKS